MKKKRSLTKVWLARKLGSDPDNAAVSWRKSGSMKIEWTWGVNGYVGIIEPSLARLLAKRINEALDD